MREFVSNSRKYCLRPSTGIDGNSSLKQANVQRAIHALAEAFPISGRLKGHRAFFVINRAMTADSCADALWRGAIQNGAPAVSDIPLHLQRKFEQRWAAKFVPPAESSSPQKQWPEKHGQQNVAPSKGKRKTRRAESAGLASALAV